MADKLKADDLNTSDNLCEFGNELEDSGLTFQTEYLENEIENFSNSNTPTTIPNDCYLNYSNCSSNIDSSTPEKDATNSSSTTAEHGETGCLADVKEDMNKNCVALSPDEINEAETGCGAVISDSADKCQGTQLAVIADREFCANSLSLSATVTEREVFENNVAVSVTTIGKDVNKVVAVLTADTGKEADNVNAMLLTTATENRVDNNSAALLTATTEKEVDNNSTELLTAATEKEVDDNSAAQLTAATEKEVDDNSAALLTAATEKKVDDNSAAQLTAATEKEVDDNSAALLTAATEKEVDDNSAAQLTAATEKEVDDSGAAQLTAATEKEVDHNSAALLTSATEKEVDDSGAALLTTTTEKEVEDNSAVQLTAATEKEVDSNSAALLTAANQKEIYYDNDALSERVTEEKVALLVVGKTETEIIKNVELCNVLTESEGGDKSDALSSNVINQEPGKDCAVLSVIPNKIEVVKDNAKLLPLVTEKETDQESSARSAAQTVECAKDSEFGTLSMSNNCCSNLDVEYLRDVSIEEYSSDTNHDNQLLDKVCTIVQDSELRGLNEDISRLSQNDPLLINFDVSNILKNTAEADDSVVAAVPSANNSSCSSSSITSKLSTGISDGNSLKQSMFRVFRDVAKSVNTEKVNENLNENFKQVYRNVLKNVTSEKFSGQALINKFTLEGLTHLKSASNESLNSKGSLPSIEKDDNSNLFSILSEGDDNLNTHLNIQCERKADTENMKLPCSINNSNNFNADIVTVLDDQSLKVGESCQTNSKTLQQLFLPHFLHKTSLIDLRSQEHDPLSGDCNSIHNSLNRLCQSENNVTKLGEAAAINFNDAHNLSVPTQEGVRNYSTQMSCDSSGDTDEGGEEYTGFPNEVSSDSEEMSLVHNNLLQESKPLLDVQNKLLLEEEMLEEDLRLCIGRCYSRQTNLGNELLYNTLEFERCEIVGIDKDQLIDFFLRMCKIWNKMKSHSKSLLHELERLDGATAVAIHQQLLQGLELQLQEVRVSLQQQQVQHQQQLEQHINARASLTDRLELLTRQCQEANTSRDAMVVKYAVAEKNVLVAQKQRDTCERKYRELEKDKDSMLARVKNMASEKTRLTQILDKKIVEVNALNRECNRQKEEVSHRDVKIKWAQSRLQSEVDTHKATQSRLEAAEAAIATHEAEVAAVRKNAERIVHDAATDQNSRANVLDKEVSEQKSRLIVEESCVRQLREELRAAKDTIAKLKPQVCSLEKQVATLKQQVHASVVERSESEALFRSLQQQLHDAHQLNTSHQNQLLQLERLQRQLDESHSSKDSMQWSLSTAQQRCSQQEAELLLLRNKEEELLLFTKTLSETNSRVQSSLNQAEEAEVAMRAERSSLKDQLNLLKRTAAEEQRTLREELTQTRTRLETVCGELRSQSEATQKLLDRVAELEGELTLQRRRNANAVKDLTRELAKVRKQNNNSNNFNTDNTNNNVRSVNKNTTIQLSSVSSSNSPVTARCNSDSTTASVTGSSVNCGGVSSSGRHGDAAEDTTADPASLRGGDADAVRHAPHHNNNNNNTGSSQSSGTPQDALSQTSRTSSNCSLNVLNTAGAGTATAGGREEGVKQSGGGGGIPSAGDPLDLPPDSQVLVQRILKLQRALAKRAEKEEFYEEHSAQLLSELQKKNKIIDYFVMKEEAGAMADNRADAVKSTRTEKKRIVQLHKARMMQQRGIMASIYGSQQKDEAMTLEFSLEINRKLQALFEDTLLKNITLKESLSTLGDEVARLSIKNTHRQ